MAEINGIKVPFKPIVSENRSVKNRAQNLKENFDSIFRKELDKIKFSNHALERLESRNIKFGDNELDKIRTAIDKAESKGAKDSLVMMNDTALIVNIPNKTVVTAMQVEQHSDNIFTNIDSVVFA